MLIRGISERRSCQTLVKPLAYHRSGTLTRQIKDSTRMLTEAENEVWRDSIPAIPREDSYVETFLFWDSRWINA